MPFLLLVKMKDLGRGPPMESRIILMDRRHRWVILICHDDGQYRVAERQKTIAYALCSRLPFIERLAKSYFVGSSSKHFLQTSAKPFIKKCIPCQATNQHRDCHVDRPCSFPENLAAQDHHQHHNNTTLLLLYQPILIRVRDVIWQMR